MGLEETVRRRAGRLVGPALTAGAGAARVTTRAARVPLAGAQRLLDPVLARVVAHVVVLLDVDAVVRRVDVDAVARRLDVEAVLDRLDLTEVVLSRVDLSLLVREVLLRVDGPGVDRVVAAADLDAAAARLDLDAVARRLDVDAVARRLDVEAVLDRLDLTEVVLSRVDLRAVVAAALAVVETDRLVSIAEQVVDGVDLPEIIRESTGSMASDTVRGVRMQGIAADEAVGRVRDRVLLRRRTPGPAAGT